MHQNVGRKVFFDISSCSTPTFRGKKRLLLIIEDITNCTRSNFLKENSDLKNVMMGLIKNLKTKYNIQVQYLCCDNAGEIVDFKRACK